MRKYTDNTILMYKYAQNECGEETAVRGRERKWKNGTILDGNTLIQYNKSIMKSDCRKGRVNYEDHRKKDGL